MTTTAMATYAYDQIDQARAELNAVSKEPIVIAGCVRPSSLDRNRQNRGEWLSSTRCATSWAAR